MVLYKIILKCYSFIMKELSIQYFLVKIIVNFIFTYFDRIYTLVVLIILKILLHYFFPPILKSFYTNIL